MVLAPEHVSLYEPTTQEMGERIEELLPVARLKKGEFGDLMDVDAAQVTRWLKGEGLGTPVVIRIANRLAGKGRLSKLASEVRDYIECQGAIDDLPLRLSPAYSDSGADLEVRSHHGSFRGLKNDLRLEGGSNRRNYRVAPTGFRSNLPLEGRDLRPKRISGPKDLVLGSRGCRQRIGSRISTGRRLTSRGLIDRMPMSLSWTCTASSAGATRD